MDIYRVPPGYIRMAECKVIGVDDELLKLLSPRQNPANSGRVSDA
jgi:hypothetical protein